MCIAFILLQAHPLYSLVIASNRDEYLARPTKPAHFWSDAPQIFAARDEEAQGTWLGLSPSRGRLAVLTNFRESDSSQRAPGTPSRGNLTRDFLLGDRHPLDELADLHGAGKGGAFQGFNLIAADLNLKGGDPQVAYVGNRDPESDGPRLLSPGIYGLSNALLDTPWPKVERGKSKLRAMVAESGGAELSPRQIIDTVLCDTTPVRAEDLPVTEASQETERKLCTAFVDTHLSKGPYATSYQTVILVRYNGQVEWHERVLMDPTAKPHVWLENDYVHTLEGYQCQDAN